MPLRFPAYYKLRRSMFAVAALASMNAVIAWAQPGWQANPIPVSTASGTQSLQRAVSDGAGGVIFLWNDTRSTAAFFAQKFDAAGNAQWTTNGVRVCATSGPPLSQPLVSDGAGGAIVLRAASGSLIAQRVDADGVVQWGANGVTVASGLSGVTPVTRAIPDGAGGAYFVYTRTGDLGETQYWIQRIDDTGAPLWGSDGIQAGSGSLDSPSIGVSIVADGAGGAIVVFSGLLQPTFDLNDIYAQRFDPSGAPQWGAGMAVVSDIGEVDVEDPGEVDQQNPFAAADGNGGIVVFFTASVGVTQRLYAQRLDSQGHTLWASGGVEVDPGFQATTVLPTQIQTLCESDRTGGGVFAWLDTRTTPSRVYAARVAGDGTVAWSQALSASGGPAVSLPRIVSASDGTAIVTWATTSSPFAVFAQGIHPDASLSFPSGGTQVASLSAADGIPATAVLDLTRAATAWTSGTDLFAQRVDASGTSVVPNYALNTTAVGSGTIQKSPDRATYAPGSQVTLTALPNAGASFFEWSGDASGSINPLTMVMDGSKSVTATFIGTSSYTLDVAAVGGGSVARSLNQPLYDPGTVVELTATPDQGFIFAGWSGDATGQTNPLGITMNGSKTITATFVTASHLIVTSTFTVGSAASYQQVTVTGSGTLFIDAPLTVSGDMTVQPGGVVTHSQGVLTGMNLTVGGQLWIQDGSRIDVTGAGLLGGSRSGSSCDNRTGQTYDGSGNVTCAAGSSGSSGGSYGGIGGTGYSGGSPAVAYGVAEDPSQLGSGGGAEGIYVDPAHAGGNGGGLVRITAGNVVVDGEISADGGSVANANCAAAYNGMAGGAGGGIKIVADVLRGSATARIHANGGFGHCGDTGGGGGGRIAIWADNQSGWLGVIEAQGAYLNLGRNTGSSGTIYRTTKNGSGTAATLLLANGGRRSESFTSLTTAQPRLRRVEVLDGATLLEGSGPGSALQVDQGVRIATGAVYRLPSGAQLTISATGTPDLSVESGALFEAHTGSSLTIDQASLSGGGELMTEISLSFAHAADLVNAGGIMSLQGSSVLTIPALDQTNFSSGALSIAPGASLDVLSDVIRLAGTLIKDGRFGDGIASTPDHITSLYVLDGGVVTHSQGHLDGLQLNARAVVLAGGAEPGRIDVTSAGLLGANRSAPGCGTQTAQTYDASGNVTCAGGSTVSAGGSFGGTGGIGIAGGTAAATYGIPEDPSHLGSGGGAEAIYLDLAHAGGNGGGLVRINADSVVVDGVIAADGSSILGVNCVAAYNAMAGGSGGGVKIVTEVFQGAGWIHANGGFNSCGLGGGGGGGRIAIYYEGSLGFPVANLSVQGGSPSGGLGTIYIRTLGLGGITGGGTLQCNGQQQPATNVAVALLHDGSSFKSTSMGANGSYLFSDVPLGTYIVAVTAPVGYATPIDTRVVTLNQANQTLSVDPFPFTCLLGDITGRVVSNCNNHVTGLLGVSVDVFRDDGSGTDVLVAVTATDAQGDFHVNDLALGDYTIGIITPLGYSAPTSQQTTSLTVADGVRNVPAFELHCQSIPSQPCGLGYWKHQVSVYLTGKGQAQETLADLAHYIDEMVEHFNSNLIHPVIVYVPGSGNTSDKLLQIQQLLTVNKGGTALDRAKQHLLSLLLNVVSGKIAQTKVVSADGATVSQAITYCYDLIVDATTSNDDRAASIAETINDGSTVANGMIPLGTPVMTYRSTPEANVTELALESVYPNPARGPFTVALALPRSEPATLELIDIAGRRVLRHDLGQDAGRHSIQLSPERLPFGIYTLRLSQAGRKVMKKVALGQ